MRWYDGSLTCKPRERGQRAFNPRSRCHSCHGPRGADVLQMPEGTKRSINHFQPDDSPLHLLNPEERLCEAVRLNEGRAHLYSDVWCSYVSLL